MNKIVINGVTLEYIINRKKMKNIRITVSVEGIVSISAPNGVKVSEIEKLIVREGEWIITKMEDRIKNKKKSIFESGKVLIRGKEYDVKFEIGKNSINIIAETLLVVTKEESEGYILAVIEKWFREYAHEIFYEKIRILSRLTGKIPENVFIKDQKRAWGSCSTKGNINMNWRVIMAPDEIIDYVIVHELCHMIHMNHSAEYWSMVAEIMPDYKKRRKWLKENGGALTL